MKKPLRAVFAALAVVGLAFVSSANAKDTTWKMDAVSNQVSVIQEVRDLQETDRNDFVCLAITLYKEARGLNERHLQAIGHVVFNRAKKAAQSICETVWKPGQFSWTRLPVRAIIPPKNTDWEHAQHVALALISSETEDPSNGATSFYNPRHEHPSWARRGNVVAVIGDHTFVRLSE